MRIGPSRVAIAACLLASASGIALLVGQLPSPSGGAAGLHTSLTRVQESQWPPHPSALVVIDSATHPLADAHSQVPAVVNEILPIFTVPDGRWLVLTDFSSSGAQLLRVVGGVPEVLMDVDITHFNPRTGFAFPPNSTVALRLLSAGSGQMIQYHFSGYYAPQGKYSTPGAPPPPQDMFVLNSREVAGSVAGYLQVPGNSTIPIFTVPPDRWLVITDPDIRGAGIRLVQIEGINATTLTKSSIYTGGHPPAVGIAVAPGTVLGVQNVLSTTQTNCNYLMTGYLADA